MRLPLSSDPPPFQLTLRKLIWQYMGQPRQTSEAGASGENLSGVTCRGPLKIMDDGRVTGRSFGARRNSGLFRRGSLGKSARVSTRDDGAKTLTGNRCQLIDSDQIRALVCRSDG